jgi:hypothetical protein
VWYITASNFIQPQATPNNIFLRESESDYSSTFVYLLQNEDVTEEQKSIFVHEFQSSKYTIINQTNPIDNKRWTRLRTFILLIKGSGTNAKYYRLEFYDHANAEYLDILRNHHYLFTVNSVRSEGYSNQFETEHHPGSNLEYTLTIDDNSQSITSNGQMAVVTSVDTVRIPGDVTDQAVTKFRYIDPPGETINLSFG